MAGASADWVLTPLARVLAILTTIVALTLSLYNIIKHIIHYNYPRTQKFIFRICLIIPIYSISSCISVVHPPASAAVQTIRGVYEAVVVYSFLTLLLEYAGGDYVCIEAIKHHPPIRHPFPLGCILPKIRRDGRLVRYCKQGTLQFVVIKPLVAVLSLIALGQGFYYTDSYQGFLLVVYNLSYSAALYALLVFYLAVVQNTAILTQYKPVTKFFAVKSIVFATFWQSVVIGLLPGISTAKSILWNDFLLCCEAVPFALLLNRAFPYKEFLGGNFAVHAFGDRAMLDNMKQVFSVGDVFQDAYHNYHASYQDYAVARDDTETDSRKFRARTFLVGNLDSAEMEKGARGGDRGAGGGASAAAAAAAAAAAGAGGRRGGGGGGKGRDEGAMEAGAGSAGSVAAAVAAAGPGKGGPNRSTAEEEAKLPDGDDHDDEADGGVLGPGHLQHRPSFAHAQATAQEEEDEDWSEDVDVMEVRSRGTTPEAGQGRSRSITRAMV